MTASENRLHIAWLSLTTLVKAFQQALGSCVVVLTLNGLGIPEASAEKMNFSPLAPVALSETYQRTNGRDLWSDNRKFNMLLGELRELNAHGLLPSHYHLHDLESLTDDPERREKMASDAWLSAAAHIKYGKLNPVTVEPDWTAIRRKQNLVDQLLDRVKGSGIVGSLNNLAPPQPGYLSLQTELRALMRLRAEGPIEKVTTSRVLKKGMTGSDVRLLNARLHMLGHMTVSPDSEHFDVSTESAIRSLQERESLDADGIVGAATLRAINRTTADRINQIRVNLERWRWLPDDLGRRHIRANIAEFSLTTYENGKPLRTHATIVGKPYRKTPVFSHEIEYVVFNPWWETPKSLARADKLPLFKRDPAAVKRLGFQVIDQSGNLVNVDSIDWKNIQPATFPHRIRQAPGSQNALGKVKIMFPNAHNVYIHDTPTKGLFAQQQRALSSGCLRTENATELAAWLLSETPKWSSDEVNKALQSEREIRADLKERVPVHVLYMTAVPRANGTVRYLDDVYERDSRVLQGINAKP